MGCTLGLMLGGLALQALAEPPAAPASNNNGLMTFPNVSVVNAPVDAAKQKPTAQESGVKVYMDGAGNMMQPSAADAAQLSNAAPARAGRTVAKSSAATATTHTAQQMTYGPDGSIEIMANEETLVFQMAHKDAQGKLSQECVTGESSAKHALHSPAHAKQESRNDR